MRCITVLPFNSYLHTFLCWAMWGMGTTEKSGYLVPRIWCPLLPLLLTQSSLSPLFVTVFLVSCTQNTLGENLIPLVGHYPYWTVSPGRLIAFLISLGSVSVTLGGPIRWIWASGQLIPAELSEHWVLKKWVGLRQTWRVFYGLCTMLQTFHTFTSGSGLGFLIAVYPPGLKQHTFFFLFYSAGD